MHKLQITVELDVETDLWTWQFDKNDEPNTFADLVASPEAAFAAALNDLIGTRELDGEKFVKLFREYTKGMLDV